MSKPENNGDRYNVFSQRYESHLFQIFSNLNNLHFIKNICLPYDVIRIGSQANGLW